MTTVGVCIGTYGDRHAWTPLVRRALKSLEGQTRPPDDFLWVHAKTLAEARNHAACSMGDNDQLIFLDADDELAACYVAAMLAPLPGVPPIAPVGMIRRPSTIGVYEDGTQDDAPVLIPRRDLRTSNYIVIGAMCPSSLFFEVGGFQDYPILEDWALWRSMVSRGAVVVDVPEAVYRVHVRPGSRNADPVHNHIYTRIRREVPL